MMDETRRNCHLPVAPPVTTATIPSTEYRFAALRESILNVCDMLDEDGLSLVIWIVTSILSSSRRWSSYSTRTKYGRSRAKKLCHTW